MEAGRATTVGLDRRTKEQRRHKQYEKFVTFISRFQRESAEQKFTSCGRTNCIAGPAQACAFDSVSYSQALVLLITHK